MEEQIQAQTQTTQAENPPMQSTENPTAPTSVPAPSSEPAPPPVPPSEDEKFFAAFGYFGPLFIITLIAKPKSLYCRFHAVQSVVMFLTTLFVFVVLYLFPGIGSLLTLALFALYVLAMYRAYRGDLWAIPVISRLTGKVNVEALYKASGLAVSTISELKEKAEGLAEKVQEETQKDKEQK